MATVPTDDELLPAYQRIKEQDTSLGLAKVLAQLKLANPEWAVSEKRLRKVVAGGQVVHPPSSDEAGLVADTGLDPTIDIVHVAPKVKARLFGGEKGKGLVAREKIQQGEVVWQEEPWLVTADSDLYTPLLQQKMCSQCFTLFAQRNPPLSCSCPHCDMAHFCNRLCLSKATNSAAHHPLLCPGQNKPALDLLYYIHSSAGRHLEAVAKIIARWRGEREWAEAGQAAEIEQRVWSGMARVNMETKEMERKEWQFTGEPRRKEWQRAHSLLIAALNPDPTSSAYKPFTKTLQRYRKSGKVLPLSDAETERWFSYESFLELLGLASINQEDSGGLYALHAHLNHSCEPNMSARNLPKTFAPPSADQLPCPPPPPNSPGVRGTNKLTMIARRTIHPGEELTLPYVNFHMNREDRRRMLRELYGFWCNCPKCTREAALDSATADAAPPDTTTKSPTA